MKAALDAFVATFTAEDTARDLAPAMTIGEAEAIAGVLDAVGEGPAAALWRSLAGDGSEVQA